MNETDEPGTAMPQVRRLTRFAVNTQDTERLVAFWAGAFDCREISRTGGLGYGASRVRLALGSATIDVLQFEQPGRPYPSELSPFDNAFQHFAIVVSDMARAYARLCQMRGWKNITVSGPQHLPDSAGGVTAFKFRDPDGHPLEFLSFPPGRSPPEWQRASGSPLFLGIDHSALSVANAERSIAFYRGLGLRIAGRSLNQGIEQELLDGVRDPTVEVIALAPMEPTPHVELLCYRNAADCRHTDILANDVSASRLIFASDFGAPLEHRESTVLLVDPDGHRLEIIEAPRSQEAPSTT